MKKILSLLIISFLSLSLQAQVDACGTQISLKQQQLLEDLDIPTRIQFRQSTQNVAITAHLIRQDNGAGGLSVAQLEDAIQNVNDFYANAGLSFFLAGINEINDTQYYDFITGDESALASAHEVPNTINIYFANSVGNGSGSFYCGYAYFPPGPDRILMNNSCTLNGSTLPHEIGHYFSLYHTHGVSNAQLTDELVDGSNCGEAGDELCDTPADPQLGSSNVNGNCEYVGSQTDANGDAFAPDPTNIMSYAPKSCRTIFSDGQYDRISYAYENFRNYLFSKAVVADFAAAETNACVGQTITFDDTSLNAVSWEWTFEGGDPVTSQEASPTVSYQSAGIFDVKLIVQNANEEGDTLIMEDLVTITDGTEATNLEYFEDFNGDFETEIINGDNGLTWSSAVVNDDSVMWIDFYNYSDVGKRDYLILPAISNDFISSFELSFDYAYTYYDNQYSDTLSVVYRPTCESEWVTLWRVGGLNLSTTGAAQTSPFIPTTEQWDQVVLDISIPDSVASFEWGLRTKNGYGNRLFVDNFSIEPAVNLITTPEGCLGDGNGSVEVLLDHSSGLLFSLDGVTFQDQNIFTGLSQGQYTLTIADQHGRQITRDFVIEGSEGLSGVGEPVTCFDAQDGSFTIEGNGSLFEFVFNGDTIQSESLFLEGLSSGTDTVFYSSDTNCQGIIPFEIMVPDSIVVELQVEKPPCFEEFGRLDVFASGGVGSFTYILNGVQQSTPEFENLEPGSYELVVTDVNGCSVTETFEIEAPAKITASIEITNPTCFGETGVLEIDAQGGTGAFIYSVDGIQYTTSNTFEVTEGTYDVIIQDENGCMLEQSVTVTEPEAITFEYEVDGLICEGDNGTVVISPSGGSGNLTVTVDGVETTTVTLDDAKILEVAVEDENGCLMIEQINVHYSFPLPPVPVIEQSGNSLFVEQNEFEVRWYKDGVLMTETATSITIGPGTYQAAYVNAGGFCEVLSEEFVVLSAQVAQLVKVYPNPVVDVISVSAPFNIDQILIFDLTGQQIYRAQSETFELNVPKGMYVMQIKSSDWTIVKKIVKR